MTEEINNIYNHDSNMMSLQELSNCYNLIR